MREQLERQIMMECCAKLTTRTQKVLDTILEQQLKAIDAEDKTAFFKQITSSIKLALKLRAALRFGTGSTRITPI